MLFHLSSPQNLPSRIIPWQPRLLPSPRLLFSPMHSPHRIKAVPAHHFTLQFIRGLSKARDPRRANLALAFQVKTALLPQFSGQIEVFRLQKHCLRATLPKAFQNSSQKGRVIAMLPHLQQIIAMMPSSAAAMTVWAVPFVLRLMQSRRLCFCTGVFLHVCSLLS